MNDIPIDDLPINDEDFDIENPSEEGDMEDIHWNFPPR